MSTKTGFELGEATSVKTKAEQEKDDEEIKQSFSNRVEVLRVKVKKFMTTHVIGLTYSEALLVLSIFSAGQFVYGTYLFQDEKASGEIVSILNVLERYLASLFGFDWALSFFIAEHKMEFVTSFFSMVDLLTIIPLSVTSNRSPILYSEVKSFDDALTYLMFGLNTTRILRALRIHRKLVTLTDEVKRSLGEMILTVFVMLMFNAAVMQYLELEVQPLEYHVWLYFAWIETATVGYGDINALSEIGRVAVMCFIGLSLIILPKMTNQLLDKMGQYSVYQRVYYTPKAKSKHVLVCGDLSSTSLIEFFCELFHEDHDVGNMIALILQPEAPNSAMRETLSHPDYSLNVIYVEGTALKDIDLERCATDTATAIFVMTNKFSAAPDEEDTKTILRQFSIKRYCHKHNPFGQQFFCLQLIRPENSRHLETQSGAASAFSDESNNSSIVVCLSQIKMGVIAKSACFPGTNTLIMNLLTSFADDDDEEDDDNGNNDDEEDDMGSWTEEYHRGCDWEIYITELAETACGKNFASLSEHFYKIYGVCLFGLYVRDVNGKSPPRLLINPKSYKIPDFKEFDVQGVVMAKNKANADLSFKNNAESSGNDTAAHIMRLKEMQMGGAVGGDASLPGLPGLPGLSGDYNPGAFANQDRHSGIHEGSSGFTSAMRGTGVEDSSGREAEEPKVIKQPQSWQKLIRTDVEKNANESQQEKLQNLEDANLRQNYYVRDRRTSLAQVTINSSVADEIPHMTNHLIILGKGLSNIYDLIRPLRSKNLGVLRYIVILNPTDIPHAVWQRINVFDGIFYIRGSALEDEDLRRAGIFRAAKVVVLATAVEESTDVRQAGALIDADAIFSYQAVKRLNERAHCVIEIVRQSSIAYLNSEVLSSANGEAAREDSYRFTPQFAGGTLFISSMLDTLSVQTYYNPLIIKVLHKMIGSSDTEEMEHQVVAGGKKPKGLAAVKSSTLFQIPIPDGLESRTYGALYRFLASTGVIPVGLFRGVFPQMKSGSKHNKMPYVYTNPPKDTELFSCDKVFVLSTSAGVKLNNKDSKEMQLIEAHLKARALSSAEASANALREDFYKLIAGQDEMRDHIGKLKHSIFDQLDHTLHSLKNLQKGFMVDDAKARGRNRVGSTGVNGVNGTPGGGQRAQSASPTKGRTRTASSIFNSEEMAAFRQGKSVSTKGRTSSDFTGGSPPASAPLSRLSTGGNATLSRHNSSISPMSSPASRMSSGNAPLSTPLSQARSSTLQPSFKNAMMTKQNS